MCYTYGSVSSMTQMNLEYGYCTYFCTSMWLQLKSSVKSMVQFLIPFPSIKYRSSLHYRMHLHGTIASKLLALQLSS